MKHLKLFERYKRDCLDVKTNVTSNYELYENNNNPDFLGATIADICTFAADKGKDNRVKELIAQGANVNYVGRINTPLFAACQSGNYDIVDLLIKAGADVNLPIRNGKTSIFVCDNAECVKLLKKAGANLNHLDDKKRTALFYIFDYNVIKELIKAGIDMTIKDEYNMDFVDYDIYFAKNIFTDRLNTFNCKFMFESLEFQILMLSKDPSMIQSLIRNEIKIHPNLPDELKHVITGGDLNLL